jgi:uncharacterized radical SAM superfamily Fe-S cluster-containing enzyme
MLTTGRCFCPYCHQSLQGNLEVGEFIWLSRDCPEHGIARTLLYRDAEYFAMAQAARFRPVTQEHCLVVEVTERCDVGCVTCSANSILAGAELPPHLLVPAVIAKAAAAGANVVALSGGEPLMRSDIWEIADAIHAAISKVVLITSGRRFESDARILAEIATRRSWLEVYLQFDSLDDGVLQSIRTPEMTADLRKQRLAMSVATGAATTAVCVVAPDVAPSTIGEVAVFCRDAGAAGVSFQPLRQVGRYPLIHGGSAAWATVDQIQCLALAAFGIEGARPRPFLQQPFDISIAMVTGSDVSWPETFFEDGDHRPKFRVATSSYWDHTNFFEPLAQAGAFYFLAGVDEPLNAHYFDAAQQAPSLLRRPA